MCLVHCVEYIKEMFNIGFLDILDTKIIHYERKGDVSSLMSEEAAR
jgi:DNA-dependent RNA polymerase auxiliary subunit epsilon